MYVSIYLHMAIPHTYHLPYITTLIFLTCIQINIRQIAYVGSGLKGKKTDHRRSFGIGDSVFQVPPDCVAVSPCPLVNGIVTPGDGNGIQPFFTQYKFARAPGM